MEKALPNVDNRHDAQSHSMKRSTAPIAILEAIKQIAINRKPGQSN